MENEALNSNQKYGFAPPRRVKAIYTESRFECDKGNILIEALPELLSRKEILEHYYKGMEIKPSLDADPDDQMEEVSFLRSVRFPLEFIRDMERTLHREIIESYRYRINDMVMFASDVVIDNAPDEQAFSFVDNIGGDGDTGLSLLGESGCGKSTAVGQMLSHYPRVIVHELPHSTFKQVVWIRAVMSVNSDLDSLYTSLARSIDEALGNMDPYYAKAISKMRRISEKADFIAKLIRRFAVGVIVIDEIQNMRAGANKESSYNSILTITNTTKVVLFTIGTEEAYPLFLRNHYTARRSGTPIRASEYCRKPEFCHKVEKWLMGVNWFKEPLLITQELLDTFYEVSLGFIGRMISIWMEVQFMYIKAKDKPEINSDFIRKAASAVYTRESNAIAKDAALKNLMFSPEENSSLASFVTKKESEDGTSSDDVKSSFTGSFAELDDVEKAYAVYLRTYQCLIARGKKYNSKTIEDGVKYVMHLKSYRNKDEDTLVAKCVDHICRKKSDARTNRGKKKQPILDINSLENIFAECPVEYGE